MTNSKSTKRALLASVLSILLSVAMLAGTTFAWFTDSVKSGSNKIVSGNLDVGLYQRGDDGSYTDAVTDETKLFDDSVLWEPGHVEVVNLKIANLGSLAVRYKFALNVANEVVGTSVAAGNPEIKLSALLKYGILFGDEETVFTTRDEALAAVKDTAADLAAYSSEGYLAPAGKTAEFEGVSVDAEAYVTLVVYMPEEIGNEANHQKDTTPPSIELGVALTATQASFEQDGFGSDYDKDAAKDLVSGASVKGIAGFEDTVFPSLQAAYAATSPVVESLGGLGQEPTTADQFNAVFSDNGNITWTIYGEQTVNDQYLFSFGRKASHYNDDCNIQNISIVGGNSTAKLVMNTSVVLPYNWWTETQPTTSCQISGLTLEQGTKNNINIGPSNGFQFNLTLKDCDINGAMYFYWNNDFNFTVDGCHFKNTENSKSQSYALLIQGNDNGTYEPHVTFTNSTVEGFQRGINLDCQNTAFVVTDNTFKSTTYILKNKSALQITRGKSFLVSGNTFESGVTGYAIELHDLLASSTVEIRNNIFDSAKGIKNSITEANQETVTVIEENNSGSAVNP